MIEQVFERRSEEIDDKDIVQAFLAEVVDIRYAGCDNLEPNLMIVTSRQCTYDIRQVFCMFCIHPVIEGHHSSSVPDIVSLRAVRSIARLTNLMATCWLLSRLVPSNMTPNDPSPIFLPTL